MKNVITVPGIPKYRLYSLVGICALFTSFTGAAHAADYTINTAPATVQGTWGFLSPAKQDAEIARAKVALRDQCDGDLKTSKAVAFRGDDLLIAGICADVGSASAKHDSAL